MKILKIMESDPHCLKVMIIMRLVTFDELIQVPVFLLPLEEPAVERHQNVEIVTKLGATIVITL